VAADDGITKRDNEGFVPRKMLCAEDGISKSLLPSLPRVEKMKPETFVFKFSEKVLFSRFAKQADQFSVIVEVIFNRRFASSGHKEHTFETGMLKLLNHILNDRLLAHGQHFLRLRLRGRKQPGAETGDGYHGISNQNDLLLVRCAAFKAEL